MPSRHYEELLYLERVAIRLEQVLARQTTEILYLRNQNREEWTGGEGGGAGGPCGASILATVTGCLDTLGNPRPAIGASVSATVGTTTVGPVAVDSLGQALLQPFPGDSGTVTATHPRFTDTPSASVSTTCHARIDVTLAFTTPAAGYQCIPYFCGYPLGTTYLHAPPANPSVAMTWSVANDRWEGTAGGNAWTLETLDGGLHWTLLVNGVVAVPRHDFTTVCSPSFVGTDISAGGVTWDENP